MRQLIIFYVIVFVSVLSAGKSATADAIIIFGTLGLTALLLFRDKKLLRLDTSKKLLLTFILAHLWSLSFSVRQSVSFLTSYQTWAYLGLVYLFSFAASFYLSTARLRSRFADGLVLLAGIISLATVFYYFTGIRPPQGDLSLFFPTYGHNRFAEFFLPITPFSVYILLDHKRSRIIRLAALFSITNLLLSFSRASLISLLSLPLIAFFMNLSADKKVKKWILSTAVIALVTFLLFTPVWLNSKGFKSGVHPLLFILDKPFTSKERIVFFTDAVSKWTQKKIHGYGPGTYQYTPQNLWADKTSTIFVHNHTLQSIYEGGMLGLFAEAVLIIWAITRARGSCRDTTDKLILAGIVLSLVQAQLDFGWEIPAVYLINLVFLFSLCRNPGKILTPTNSKLAGTVALSLLVFALLFSLLSFWNVFPWGETTQVFRKLIMSGHEKGDEQLKQKTLNNWLRLEGGNGEVYKWLYQFNLDRGNFKESFNNFVELSKTVYLRNSLDADDLTKLIDEISVYPAILSVQDRFELLNIIGQNYYPHDFFWLTDGQRTAVYSIIDTIFLSPDPPFLADSQLAKLHYWKYTQMFTRGMTDYGLNQRSIDLARSLDPTNQHFDKISQINKALVKPDEPKLLELLDKLPDPTLAPDEPSILLSLRDHINMRLGDIYMKKDDLENEMKHRREALMGTQTAIAYIQLAKRLAQLNQKIGAASILEECTKLYPDCQIWFEKSLK